jgi:hypothetical protein
MASHWPFGHLQTKLWAKEGPGVKLAVWLSTTKSRESTSSRHSIREYNTALERSWRGLQLWFRPRCDRTLQSEVMSSQSPRILTGTVSGLQLGSPGKKSHLDVASVRSCREYYKGEGGGFPPSPARGVSCESELVRGSSQHQMHAEWFLTNSCWFWMQVRDQIAWFLPSLIPELPTWSL